MQKIMVRIFIVLVVAVIFSSIFNITFSESFVSTLYNVSGIVFSIGLGLIVSFNIDGVKEKDYIREIRNNIRKVRNSFIKYFSLATFVYSFYNHIPNVEFFITSIPLKIEINWSWVSVIFILFSILYFLINFIQIQKLKDDIFDKLNK